MEKLIGIYFIFMGILMIFKPKFIWKISESWKMKNKSEPNKLYIILVKTGGIIIIIGGIFVIFESII